MLNDLVIIVLIAAIVVFFSREFIEYIKKIIAIPGMAWLLPIVLASILIVYFNIFIMWLVLICRLKLQSYYVILASHMPFFGGNIIAAVILLMLFAVLPIYLMNLYCKREFYKDFSYRYIASLLIWLFCASLLII